MKKKRVAALLLSSLMAVSMLAGCGSSSSTSTSSSEAEETEETVDETEEEASEESEEAAGETEYAEDVQAIIDRGVLRVGVKNAVIGFGYQDELTGEYEGMEIELAQMIADYLGVDVEYTAVTAATRTELLDSGDIDCVLATFTITEERQKSWDFTTPYYTDYVTVLVENSSGITSLADLVDAKVGVSSGSTSAKSLTEAMIEGGYIDGTEYDAGTFDAATWTTGISFQQYDDYPTISTALSAGEVDAFCVDKSILAVYNTDSRSYIEDEFTPQEYGVATTKDSGMSELCETLITGWLEDGTIDGLITEYGID
ncbi:MAG: transporter substrate-binding domain-containing protein [Lachnospiraceae bacterium]|nr:transporter substrate-binding domain-containing protein [Lachnospiraceae bacterium]